MRIAIIPARGGSKRIPRKNIRPFAGKPMIAYAIAAARESRIFDQIIVSTDDNEIRQIALAHGATAPFVRPAELADDYTPTNPVITHALEQVLELGWSVTHACCIYPSVPFIQAEDIVRAHQMLVGSDAEYCFPIAEYPSPVQRALRQDASGRVSPLQPQFRLTRTQDLEPAFFDAGQFYWGTADGWRSGRTAHETGIALRIPPWRVVDIDTLDDWRRAELMHLALSSQSNRTPSVDGDCNAI